VNAAMDHPAELDLAGRDVHGEADRLRARCPVARIALPGGVHPMYFQPFTDRNSVIGFLPRWR